MSYVPLILTTGIWIIVLPGCLYKSPGHATKILVIKAEKQNETTQTVQPPAINVWIHGTRLFPSQILKSFFYAHPGLSHYSKLDPEYHIRTIADTLIASNPQMFPAETFYLFGWPGKLNFTQREEMAEQLYNQLQPIIDEYQKKYGVYPFIRLLAHSHGGNVALNLALPAHAHEKPFEIAELILLACPVQKRTMHLIDDPIFKKIYALYSRLDLLQVVDPQGLYKGKQKSKLFSDRCFNPHSKLTQVKIKMNGRAIMHVEFILAPFLKNLAAVIEELESWEQVGMQQYKNWACVTKLLAIYTNGRKVKK